MGEKKDYDSDVYRRLALVQKQFKSQSAAQKKEQATQKRLAFVDYLRQNKIGLGRLVVYVILGIVLAAVILVVVFAKI